MAGRANRAKSSYTSLAARTRASACVLTSGFPDVATGPKPALPGVA